MNTTRKYILKFSLLFFSFLIILSCNNKEEIILDKNYSKDEINFSYPSNWVLENSEQTNVPILLFRSGNEDDNVFRENINLLLTSVDENIDFNTHIQNNKNALKLSDIPILEESDVKINNQKAYKVSYERLFEGNKYKILQYLFLDNKQGYTLTFTCRKENFAEILPEADEILNSFRFNNK